MITGETKTEHTYRNIMLDSSSSLKDFAQNRKKYFSKYFLHEEVEEEDSKAITMGKLVETLLLEPELFDKKFYMSACANTPTALMLAFVEALYKHTVNALNEEGVMTKEFKDISLAAYNDSGFKIKYEAVIQKFAGSDAEIYYNEILKVRTDHLIVVTIQDVTNAEAIVDGLKNNIFISETINLVTSNKIEVINQLQVENYPIGPLHFKSMMDKVIIDHENKIIYVYDLKCTWAVENFYEDYYLYRKGYIQAYVYHVAIQHYRNEKLPGYSIQPMKFIVCDSTNYYSPLIYALTFEDLKEAKEGFEHRGRKYTGVDKIVEDLSWALEMNIWDMSKENYETNGIVPLKKRN